MPPVPFFIWKEENSLPKFIVTKVLDFCYAHRLLNYEGKCKHLHGHQARVELDIAADQLDEQGMVCDFFDIKASLKPWIDEKLDHQTLLNRADPIVPFLKEFGEPIFLISENPTAENIAKLIFQKAKSLGWHVSEVRLWETNTSLATYREE